MVENQPNIWQALLGYLNFSEGRPDPRFQGQLNDAFRLGAEQGAVNPVEALADGLRGQLANLRGTGAFADVRQVEAVLSLVFTRVLPGYRQHHSDLLAHQSDRDLFQPFFLARAFEAVLAQGAPWTEEKRITTAALAQLNDYVGHRPIAVLESRPRGEPYEHERVRPVPLYLRGAGVAWGRYHDLVARALELLTATDPAMLQDACFDPNLLDELAFDPRAYDHGHPVNRRPNYVFGEWDPHHIDNQGRYRRFVVRQLVLEALMERVEQPGDLRREELLFEAAAVLAGVILMAAGVSGWGPGAHDSSVTLATLVQQRIPRYRDAFYSRMLNTMTGPHGDRLRAEMASTRQPFGGVRQHLNQYITRQRAGQLQQRHLARVFAEMGYPEASRAQAALIPTPSVRLLSEILLRLTLAPFHVERGELATAAELLPQAEELLRRGIKCGAFADPWNIIGFQALFPLFQSREDSIRDVRVDELVDVMQRMLDLYARLLGEASAAGDEQLGKGLSRGMRRLAHWWDQFASTSVSDVRRVHGGEAADAAENVAGALARWHQQGEAAAGPAFWKQQLEHFRAPKAFALVVDALLRKRDFRASMGLLISWLSQAEQVPLEDGDFSFHALALRWLHVVTGVKFGDRPPQPSPGPANGELALVRKFFDYLEVNAEENWEVPELETVVEADEDEEENPFQAAYDDVTYKDSASDGREGALLDDAAPNKEFELEVEGQRLEKRLRFLSTVARLWEVAARHGPATTSRGKPPVQEALGGWLARARANRQRLLALLDAIHQCPIPESLGSFESNVEYDRRRVLKERLLEAAIGTCLDTTLAVHALEGAAAGAEKTQPEASALPAWQPLAIQLEQALLHGDADQASRVLPGFLTAFRPEPLLFVPLSSGGHPAAILRARFAQAVLQTLVEHLPYLGLLRETYHLLVTARAMEAGQLTVEDRKRVTEFDRLFQLGFQGVIETTVDSARTWDGNAIGERDFVNTLEALTRPFLQLWIDHSSRLGLSSLEEVPSTEEWQKLREFITAYGRDLFQAKFMTLGNLRGVLHRGVGAYLDYLRDNPEPTQPVRLIADLDRKVPRDDAIKHLRRVISAVIENFEEYKDYKTTTPQSDYGENLHALLDFLRIKASYDRHAWQFRPLVLVHEVLARRECVQGAMFWQEAFTSLTRDLAEQHVRELARLEQQHGFRLRTVSDHLEQRFVKPLAIDRLCVLVSPAMAEARQPGATAALARFQEELKAHASVPSGSGLDAPNWLRRLEREVQRVRAERTTLIDLSRRHFAVPRATLSYAAIRQQLLRWDDPLEGKGPAPSESSPNG